MERVAFFISGSERFRLLYAKFSSVVTYDHRDKERNRTRSNMCQLSGMLSFRGYDHHRYRRSWRAYCVCDEWGGETMLRLDDGWCPAVDRETLMCTIYETDLGSAVSSKWASFRMRRATYRMWWAKRRLYQKHQLKVRWRICDKYTIR